MNEARVVIVHNSKSKKDNLNVYIYCCHYHAEVRKKEMCHQKEEPTRRTDIATLKKYLLFVLI